MPSERSAPHHLGRLALPAIAVLLLLVTSQGVAAVPTTKGVTQPIGNVLDMGVTSYQIYYSYPSVVQVGTNLTISLSLHLNPFQGQIEAINGYGMQLQLFVGANVLQSTISGPSGLNTTLFPGATWGPENFTFPLTENSTGITPGTSENATLSVTLRDFVLYGVPELMYESEPPMTAQAGSLIIENQVASNTTSASTSTQPGSGQSLLPYALLASGAVLMVAAVFIPRGPRPLPAAAT